MGYERHPEGLVVGVPQRGVLLYTPAANTESIEQLSSAVRYVYSKSDWLKVSASLFLFKNNRWSVFEPASRR